MRPFSVPTSLTKPEVTLAHLTSQFCFVQQESNQII